MLKIYDAIKLDFANLDKIALFAMLYAAFALTCIYYLNSTKLISELLRNTPIAFVGDFFNSNDDNNLRQLSFWFALLTIFYFLIPAFFIKFVFGKNLTDFGLKLQIEEGFLYVLLLCLAIMIPLVFLASLTSGFVNKYPFLKIFNWRFVFWLYASCLGNRLYSPIFLHGIFLSRVSNSKPEKLSRTLRNFCNDDSILHDSFWQTCSRSFRGYHCRSVFGLAKLYQRKHLARTYAPLFGCFADGFSRTLSKEIIVLR